MNQERLMKVLLGPLISEKSTRASDENLQFVFRVMPDANKPEIGRAVELMFDVEVDCVQVLNVKGKSKRFGARQGRRPNWRKAYVRLKPGYDIDFGGGA
ncbi:MAG TPA: 50S ribosomal protein L23 [Chromatiaceae bacterium]|jgi:large subunit ribosomal protein L23|nr:MAG: 50S ribosomal protein L23 [Thiohalocapsa sp. PB-PSB1]HBG94299.1 50S ribosomal protein L23 [Chromatiaceae bacterium]HCS89361.1 50S ribosomal protein L23 [Chromatiaceae bacterium]